MCDTLLWLVWFADSPWTRLRVESPRSQLAKVNAPFDGRYWEDIRGFYPKPLGAQSDYDGSSIEMCVPSITSAPRLY